MVNNDYNFLNFQLNDIEEEPYTPPYKVNQQLNNSFKSENNKKTVTGFITKINPTKNSSYDIEKYGKSNFNSEMFTKEDDLFDNDLIDDEYDQREVDLDGFSCFSQKKNIKWTKSEDDLLSSLVEEYKGKSWKKISSLIPGRTAIQCLHRWTKILKPGLVKGPWTAEEDRMLINYVNFYGAHDFSECSKIISGRNNKQCRERWFNVLNPKVIKGEWTLEEDYLIFRLYTKFGGKWIKFLPYFNGLRAENSIKNRFYSTIRRFNTVLRKKDKEVEEESKKIEAIFYDFKVQLMTKYSLLSDSDIEKFEKSELGFNGFLDETKKDAREIFYKDLISKTDKDSKRNENKSQKLLTVTPPLFKTQNNSKCYFLTSNTPKVNEHHRPRKCTFTENGINELLSINESQSMISKTPYIKAKPYLNLPTPKLLSIGNIESHQKKISTPSIPIMNVASSQFDLKTSNPKPSSQANISELEDFIVKYSNKPIFVFKDEDSKRIENKLLQLSENYSFDPFKLNQYDNQYTQDYSELSTSIFNENSSQSSFSGLMKQMSDLENLISKTKLQLSENLSGNIMNIAKAAKNLFKSDMSLNMNLPMSNDVDEMNSFHPLMNTDNDFGFNRDYQW